MNKSNETLVSVQDYYIRFNFIYNEIPDHLRPPVGLAMMKFPDGFDADMAYQLRERTGHNGRHA